MNPGSSRVRRRERVGARQVLSHAVVRLRRKSVPLLTFQSSTRRWALLHEQRFRWLGGLSNLALHQLPSEETHEGQARNCTDEGRDIALNSAGNAYVTGYTCSANFPTVNPLQPTLGGVGVFQTDAFITKLSSQGSQLGCSTKIAPDVVPSHFTYFAQVAVGGGYSTIFTLGNTGSTMATGRLILTDQDGNPLQVTLAGANTDLRAVSSGEWIAAEGSSTFDVAIPSGGTRISLASRAADLKSGWARMESSGGSLSGVATFQLSEGSVLKTVAGVLASQPVEFVTIPVDNDDSRDTFTGFAVANTSSENVNIKLVTLNENGTIVDNVSPSLLNPLGPQKQVTKFIHEPGILPSRLKFRGSMVLLA